MPEDERERRRRRIRDVWQLDIPLAVALVICTSATVIEFRRAVVGNWRAGVYMFEWPLMGAFCIWMWFRFRREGGSFGGGFGRSSGGGFGGAFGGMARRWRERVARYEAEADAEADADAAEAQAQAQAPRERQPLPGEDPELDAWRAYSAGLQEKNQTKRPD